MFLTQIRRFARSAQSVFGLMRSSHTMRRRKSSFSALYALQQLESRFVLTTVTAVSATGPNVFNGSGALNAGEFVTFTVTFDAAVNVNLTNGSPSLFLSDGGSATFVGGSASNALTFQYVVTQGRNSPDLGVIEFELNGSSVRDQNGTNVILNGAATNPSGTLVIDTLQPLVQSINRKTPAGPTTNATSVTWTVTFSEPVTGIDLSDFQISVTGKASYSQMQLSPVSSSVYDVTLTGVAGDGTLGLKLVDNESIQDTAGNQLASLSSKISFRTQSQLPAGQVSVPVEVSDLNRDGWQDVVAANHDDGVVGIFLGLGDGTFLNQMTFPAGNNPIALAIGDLNGDGIPDLVVTNESDAVASVLIGNGDGTFQTRQTYSTGSAPFDVALGDVNNDGKLDAVTVNINDTASVSILLGNGDGTFQSQRQLGYGTGSTSIKLSDLNADNNLDLLITNLHTDQLLVIHGNGDSTFRTAQTFAVGVDPWSSGLGDINNDGRLDIAVSNNNGHTLSLLLGNGEGAFQAHQTLPTGVSPTSVYIADLNGDRIPDLLNDNFNSNSVSVFRGNGNGTFQSVQSFPIGINPRVMVLSDFNDDGRPDLVTANQASGNLSILINNSRGDFVGQVYNIGIQLLTPSPSTQALRPTFTWTPAVGATSYELQISNDSTGAARYHMSTVTGTSYSPPTDLAIGRFRIWIRPIFGTTRGNWTPAYNFSILAPVAWKPVNRIQLTSQPTLEWQTLPGAVKYDLWIDNVSTGQKQVVRQELTTTAWTPSADLPMGIYRAWIRGIDARGTLANWSPFLEFVVVPGPTPIGPLNGTFDRTPAFAWSSVAGASSYELYLKNLNTQAMVINGLSMTATSYSPPTNLVDGLYRWWVVAVSPPGTGSLRSGASNPANIYVGGRPSITTPAQGSTTADRTPLFAWTGIEGAATYRLQVDRINVPQSGIILQTGLTGTTFTPVTDLPAGTFRAWIRAVSVGGELSPWSLEVNFTVT